MSSNKKYYDLSIVATTRNDNHGGDQLNRVTLFIRGLIHQCNKFRVNAELVIVEWNPPPNKPLLKAVLPLPGKDDLLTVRFIIVPNEIHSTLRHSDKIPLFQMIAKNVGIRRAKGEFILCTNIDLLFADPIFEFFSKKQLSAGTFYRAIRADIPKEIDYTASVENLLKFAKQNIIKRSGKITFGNNIRNTQAHIYKIPFVLRIASLFKALQFRFFVKSLKRHLEYRIVCLDTSACGDFTLMAKSDWEKVFGYPEFEAYSIHIDSLAIISAAAIGIKQVILPLKACSFHISHEDGWENADPIRKLYKDIDRPMLDWSSVENVALHLFKTKEPLKINTPTWGFAENEFEEFIFGIQ
ncbi:MAG: hypothetical protein AAF502_15835 [Bacteroidota bacterium]